MWHCLFYRFLICHYRWKMDRSAQHTVYIMHDLPNNKTYYRRVSESIIVSYHHHIIDFPRKNKHKENSKRTLARNQFQNISYVYFHCVEKSFLVFNFAMPMNTISGMLKWLKLIQYSRTLCLTYKRKFSLISVSELLYSVHCIDYGAYHNHFTFQSKDWIDSKSGHQLFLLMENLTLMPNGISFFFSSSLLPFNSNPHIILNNSECPAIKCLITISVHCSFHPSQNKKLNETKDWIE